MRHFSFDCEQGAIQLTLILTPSEGEEDSIKASACWALGQLGRHSPQHAQDIAEADAFPLMLDCALSEGYEDLQIKVGSPNNMFCNLFEKNT